MYVNFLDINFIWFSSFDDEKQGTNTKTNESTCDGENAQSHDQEECNLNSAIIMNSDVHTLIDDKIIIIIMIIIIAIVIIIKYIQ